MTYFDRAWHAQGHRGLKSAYYKLGRIDHRRLIYAVADNENSFPVMYLLEPDIEADNLEVHLQEHVIHAYWLMAHGTGDHKKCEKYAGLLTNAGATPAKPPKNTLKWMINTGANWDGPSAGRDSFDAAIDLAAAHLAAEYPDSESLKKIAALIFRRHRQGLLIHDLVWGFFQAADAEALSDIAKYILSDNSADIELACKLLNLDPPKTHREKVSVHKKFTDWLSENRPYLYLTGESFNASAKPCHLALDQEAKFVSHEIDPRTGEPLIPYSQDELRAIEVFRAQNGGFEV